MTSTRAGIDERARRRLAADEARFTGGRRTSQTLGRAARGFWRHPSPYLIGTFWLGSVVFRSLEPRSAWTELITPTLLVALFPVIEWVVHVVVLHWRPRRLGGIPLDSLLSRKHREHHADPRHIPLVFIPWQAELVVIPALVLTAVLALPTWSSSATTLVVVSTLLLGYEWVHYLVHSDYRPRSRAFRAVWRNHRLHHYKNENYWFTVTTAGTADRLFGTYPELPSVPTSPTVRDLHAADASRSD